MNEMQDMQENLEKFKAEVELSTKHKFPMRKDFKSDQEFQQRLDIIAVE